MVTVAFPFNRRWNRYSVLSSILLLLLFLEKIQDVRCVNGCPFKLTLVSSTGFSGWFWIAVVTASQAWAFLGSLYLNSSQTRRFTIASGGWLPGPSVVDSLLDSSELDWTLLVSPESDSSELCGSVVLPACGRRSEVTRLRFALARRWIWAFRLFRRGILAKL